MWPLSIIYLYQNCGLYLRAACINYFSSYLWLVFEGGFYLKAASIGENTVSVLIVDYQRLNCLFLSKQYYY